VIDLDDAGIYRRLDPGGMGAQLHGLPRQCRDAWDKAVRFTLPPDYKKINKVVILGMGGSAIGADLVRSLTADKGGPVIFVNRDYDLPSFVDDKTLVIASSYSGNT
jgi:glucose/mannose-6-phosphate isomerase